MGDDMVVRLVVKVRTFDLRSKPANQAPEWLKALATLRNGNAGMYGTVTKRGRIEVGQTVFLELGV